MSSQTVKNLAAQKTVKNNFTVFTPSQEGESEYEKQKAKRFMLFKALNDCEDIEEFEYQKSRAWHEKHGLDYDLLNTSPTPLKTDITETVKTVKITKEGSETVKKTVTIDSREFRRLTQNLRVNFNLYKEGKGRIENCKKYLQLLKKAGVDCKMDLQNMVLEIPDWRDVKKEL